MIAVVLFHAFPATFTSGFAGVDIFFVISGYLISGIIRAEVAAGQFHFRTFYERRVRRIFPALVVVLLASLAVGWLLLFPDEFLSLGEQVAGGAGFIANIVLWRQTGYFDAAASTKPLLHLWSLGVEEQFYLVWPVLLILGWKLRRSWTVLLTVSVASFALNAWFVSRSPDATFYLPITRFWELLLGAALTLATVPSGSDLPAARSVASAPSSVPYGFGLSCLGGLLLLVGLLLLDESDRFPGWWALLPTVGTAALIASGPESFINRAILAQRWLVWIGLISYPLYLWHWPLLVFLRIVRAEALSAADVGFAVVGSLALAWLTYRLIERPVRLGRRSPAVVGALCVSMAAVAVAGVLAADRAFVPLSARGDLQRYWDASADWAPYGTPFVHRREEGIDVVTIGDDTRPRVLFIGDSNVEQFGPRIERVVTSSPQSSRRVEIAAVGGCPPIPAVRERKHPDCFAFVNRALAMARSPGVERVVVGGCWTCYLRQDRRSEPRFNYYVDTPGGDLPLNSGPESDRVALGSLRELLWDLAKLKPVFLLLNVPTGRDVDPRRMIRRDPFGLGFEATVPTLTRDSFLREYGSLRAQLIEVAKDAGAQVIDPLDVLCPDPICPVVAPDGRPIYKDQAHLRPFYAREHASFIDDLVLFR